MNEKLESSGYKSALGRTGKSLGIARWRGAARFSRKAIVNIVIIGLVIYGTARFADWVRPSLTSEQLFTPPVVGPQAVKVAYVDKKELMRTVTYSGVVKPYERVAVRARTNGFVKSVYVYPGDRVRKSQVLVQLETSELLPRLRHAEAQLQYGKSELARDEKLFKGKAISASALDRSRERERIAAAKVELLQTMIGYATRRGPSDGWVSKRAVDPGQFAQRGQLLLAYDRLSKVRIRFNVAVQDLTLIRVGSAVILEMRGIPKSRVKGTAWETAAVDRYQSAAIRAKVTSIFPSGDEKSLLGTVEVMIDNPKTILRANTYVVGHFVTGRVKDAWIVPETALTPMPSGKTVIFLGPAFSDQGEAEMREVVVGLRNGKEAQILSGISEPGYVVIAGNRSLTAGETVMVVERVGQPN